MNVWVYECTSLWVYECMSVWVYYCIQMDSKGHIQHMIVITYTQTRTLYTYTHAHTYIHIYTYIHTTWRGILSIYADTKSVVFPQRVMSIEAVDCPCVECILIFKYNWGNSSILQNVTYIHIHIHIHTHTHTHVLYVEMCVCEYRNPLNRRSEIWKE